MPSQGTAVNLGRGKICIWDDPAPGKAGRSHVTEGGNLGRAAPGQTGARH